MWHLCLPLCHIPWGWSSLWLCSFLSPCLSSSSPVPDGQQSGEDTGRGRCVYLPETKRCSGADGNAPGHVALSDTAVTLHWSPHCRQNLFSLTVALHDLFVAFRIWQYKSCHQRFFFQWILLHFHHDMWDNRRIKISAWYLLKLHKGFLEATKVIMWIMKIKIKR